MERIFRMLHDNQLILLKNITPKFANDAINTTINTTINKNHSLNGINFCLWAVLHQFAENFPLTPTPKEKQEAIYFFHGFAKAIPCENPCRAHYLQYIKKTSHSKHT